MKQTNLRQIRQTAKAVDSDYVTLDVAALSTGFTKARLLQWRQECNIRHSKRHRRWMIHKADLQQDSSGDPS